MQIFGFIVVCLAGIAGLGYFVANAIEKSNEEIWEYGKEDW